jgi:hypothetical protein
MIGLRDSAFMDLSKAGELGFEGARKEISAFGN